MRLSDLIFDRCCRLCGCAVDEGVVCEQCDEYLKSIAKVRRRKMCFEGKEVEARYLFFYNDEKVKKLLFSLKRISDRELFDYAASLYFRLVPEDFCGTVTNPPRRGLSIRSAGFDQVAEPCKIMCKANKDRLKYEKILRRRGFSYEQKNLSSIDRKRNIKGKFRIKIKDIPKNILIVDDVVTTGSTALECASVIMKANPDVNLVFAFLASRN